MRMRIFGIAVLIFALAYFVYQDRVASFYKKALPTVLEVTSNVSWGSDVSWSDIISPIRTEACGAVVFQLRSDAIEKIQDQGVAFFRNAREGRGNARDNGFFYSYDAWQPTPAPSKWFGDGVVTGSMSCAGFGARRMQAVKDGASRAGGFFTTRSNAQLIMLPSEQIAVLTYFD
ncbi:hypothetical protein [Rhizobium sp. BR 314]|uniref:hypothetical protein n=1 Tax=Rhizobium sp. BR 314 TaxID=3040013 RepID=UPI0039BF13BE